MQFLPPEEIWIDESVAETPIARGVRSRAKGIPVKMLPEGEKTHEWFAGGSSSIARGKRILALARQKSDFFKPCPCSEGVKGCGYDILNSANNCSLGCTYCILQQLMTNPALIVYANIDDLAAELGKRFAAEPDKFVRVGTGEFADSLDMEPLTEYGAELVKIFSRWPNAVLELKSKTDFVDSLIGLDPGNTVIGWSVNPPGIVASEERRCATLEERLRAASRVSDAGYRVGFHFDPIIHYPGWRDDYSGVVRQIAEAVPSSRIAWISLGALRMPPAMKPTIRERFPDTPILDGEFVKGADGKLRYFQPIRVEIFRHMTEQIELRLPGAPYYLCMEPEAVWRRALGRAPSSDEILKDTLRWNKSTS